MKPLPPPVRNQGLIAAIGAYVMWGLFPLLLKPLQGVPAMEVVAHRIFWSALLLAFLLLFGRGFASVWNVIKNPPMLTRVSLGALVIMANWLIFIWAVGEGRLLEASLGYFITPLVNTLFGMSILRERLSRLQQLALLFAVLGVINEAVHLGSLPWISLVLAFASGLYGLLRKQLAMDPSSGLFLETLIVLPFALAWLLWLELHGGGHFAREPWPVDLLLFTSGLATALPLLLFAVAARSLPLTTIGFLQYLTPSISFLLAVFVFQETLSPNSTLTFAAIWFSLTIYSVDILKRRNKSTT